MGMHSTTQAFQFDVPFEQLFQLAIPAAQSVPKATVTFADPNRQVVTFDTPMSMMSWGENIVAGFIPSEGSTVVEVTCTTKGLPQPHAGQTQSQDDCAVRDRSVQPRADHRCGGHSLLTARERQARPRPR